MAKVVIFGTGRGADTAYRYLSQDSEHQLHGFSVEAAFLDRPTFHGLPIVAWESVVDRFPPDEYRMFVPLGFQQMNELRAAKYLDAKSKGYGFISYVSSRAYSLEKIAVGENCFILDHQILNPDVRIGNNVTMWSGNHVGDRTTIGDHVWISSHVTLSGDVIVGDYCFLGVNATVSNNVRLASRTFVGAGALITKHTVERGVYIAPAAKQINISSDKFLATLNIT